MKHSNYNESKYELQHEEGGLSIILKPVVRSGYQYKYNGKEYQDELGLNLYDMDFRDYDPAIARWTGIDPVVHHGMSTYMAFDGNLVFWADPSGADSQTIYGFDGTGYSIGDNDLTTVWQAGNINDDSSLEDVLGRYFPSTNSEGNYNGSIGGVKKNKGAAEVNDISNQNRIPKPPGYVIFKDLTVDQLNLFRVIPENAKDAYDLIIPLNNKIYETDGLYTTNWSDGEYWYKIAGGKFIEINVTASTIYFKDVTFILSIANIISSHGFQPLENHHWTYNPFDTRPKTY